MTQILLIAAGGSVGAVLRFLVSGWCQRDTVAFPVGTLVVNVVGCFLMGLLATLVTESVLDRAGVRPLVLIGLLGALTTFSTFSFETLRLLESRQYLLAGANVIGTNVVCLFAAWAGVRVAMRLGGLA